VEIPRAEYPTAPPCGVIVNENHIHLSDGVTAMTLRVVPAGLAGAGAAIEGLTARLAAANAAAEPLITTVVPPAADPVSVQSAAGFSVRGSEHSAVVAQGAEELGRAGVGVGDSGARYAARDAAAAASYHGAGY
jgi:hypothetical protein